MLKYGSSLDRLSIDQRRERQAPAGAVLFEVCILFKYYTLKRLSKYQTFRYCLIILRIDSCCISSTVPYFPYLIILIRNKLSCN